MGITFKEIGDDCSLCPIGQAGICHGLINHGNGPVYPPCSEMDEDTDVEAYMADMRDRERRREEARKEKAKAEAEKKHKNEMKKKRRQVSDAYCRKELDVIKALEKMLKQWEEVGDSRKFDLMFAEAMEKGGISFGNTEQMRDDISLAETRIEQAKAMLEEAKKQLAIKRAEVQKTDAYKAIK